MPVTVAVSTRFGHGVHIQVSNCTQAAGLPVAHSASLRQAGPGATVGSDWDSDSQAKSLALASLTVTQ